MTAPDFLFDGPPGAALTVALAHGAGAPMDSDFMAAFAEGLAAAGFRVARFEFPYMAERRRTGKKRPPDRAPVLVKCWRAVIGHLGAENLVIGGKSLGGRMATMVAAGLEGDGTPVRGLVSLGYPFHAPGRPRNPRVDHLKALKTPALFLQGSRDPFGGPETVSGYGLAPAIRLHWLADGDHGFRPRKASGRTERQNLEEAIAAIAGFVGGL
ncbi:MAG: alpha/beta fold hydrolase [Rhodospirillales bacterium]